MSAIELSGVSLFLGGRTVLADVSLAIGKHEFIGVFGPNGAGKTTLMRAILGLLAPSRGTIRVLGKPPSRGNPGIGYVPQVRASSTRLRLSGWDVVASVFDSHRMGLPVLSKAGAQEVARAIDLVGAQALVRRPLTEMSGGERQRLFLAQALVGRPKLLLLDEPLITRPPESLRRHNPHCTRRANCRSADSGVDRIQVVPGLSGQCLIGVGSRFCDKINFYKKWLPVNGLRWCRVRDLNPRPSVYKTAALPLC